MNAMTHPARRWRALFIFVAFAVLCVDFAAAQAPTAAFRANEVLVLFKEGTTRAQRTAILARNAGRLRRTFTAINVDHVDLPAGTNVAQVIAQLQADPDVVAAQPNFERHIVAAAPPNDPYWTGDLLWGLGRINMPAVWTNFGTGTGTVVIADIDTGVNYNHPDLAANMWVNPGETPGNGLDDDHNGYIDDVRGIDAVNNDVDPMDDNGHGTHTAGTIAAIGNNGVGVVGVNWNAKILPCKFLDVNGSGFDSDAIECFNYITALKNRGVNIRVSNNSWGGPRGGSIAAALMAAIDAAGTAGIVNIFAAGNAGSNNDVSPFDPASFPSTSIIAVAASDQNDNRAGFSNYGATSVDLAAPGVTIWSTYGAGYGALNGTSMATPHVAGAAALLFSIQPQLTVATLKSLMLANVTPLAQWAGVVASGGRLDVQLMFLAALQAQLPGPFGKTSPASGAGGLNPASVGLSWGASTNATSYEYCVDTSNNSTCDTSWTSTTNLAATLSGLGNSTTYYWQVRGRNASGPTEADGGTWWSFATSAPPAAFGKSSPVTGATGLNAASVALVWGTSTNATSYEYCVDTSNNGTCDTSWLSTASSGATLSGLAAGTTYAWQVRARNALTTTDADGGTWWTFATAAAAPRVNVAAATAGATTLASSSYSPSYPASGAINGERSGVNWGNGSGWNDATSGSWPDWLEVDFNGSQTIGEIDVFSVQDNYQAPVAPFLGQTFSLYGLTDFQLQTWDGTQWVTIPVVGTVTANNQVWKQVTFSPITTTKIRLNVTGALNFWSRVAEIEAWTP